MGGKWGRSYFWLFLFLVLTLANCAEKAASNQSGTGGYSLTPTSELNGVEDALEDIPTDTQEEKEAIGTGIDAIGDLRDSYGLLKKGMSPNQALAFFRALAAARERAEEAARLLRAVGLAALADAFEEIAAKENVLRFAHPNGDHFYTNSAGEGANAATNLGYKFEGVGFRVYRKVRNGCNRKLYRCIQPGNGSHFTSTAANCEGQKTEGEHGLICENQIVRAANPLHRLIIGGGPHHLTTPDENEKNVVAASGKYEGIHGFIPN